MEAKKTKQGFRFSRYYVTESLIRYDENNKISDDFSIRIDPSGILEKDIFKLKLETYVEEKNKCYSVYVSMVGVFKFKGKAEDIYSFFTLNAPAILFPYVRSYISSLTSVSGVDTVIIPTLNLTKLKEELEANIKVVDDSILKTE